MHSLIFGIDTMAALEISEENLTELAKAAVMQKTTNPGVQKKLSLHLSGLPDSRLTIAAYPTGYILKPQTMEYPFLPEFEDLAMRLAATAGIKTVPHAFIKTNPGYAYITNRIDRDIHDGGVRLYATEDFCQLANRPAQDKYKGSYENCSKIIRQYSGHPGLDLSELFLRVVFSFIIGNSDMHLKNYSLIESEPSSRQFYLSGTYDMLPVNIILPEDDDQLALTAKGKKRNILREDFMEFAGYCSIPVKSANAMMSKLISLQNRFLVQCDHSYLPDEYKIKIKELIMQRTNQIR